MVGKCFESVNRRAWWLFLATGLLLAATCLRSAEYDEQYTLFLTAGTPRPIWPDCVFPASVIRDAQFGTAGPLRILHDLRMTDVHPPLYFWLLAAWRYFFGASLIAARLFSVSCGLLSLLLLDRIAHHLRIARAATVALLLGCYGFAYTNTIARNFALAELLTLGGAWLIVRRTHPVYAGLLFGAACTANYLAIFPAAALILTASAWPAALGILPGLLLDAWCFAAQHGSRDGQFPPFALWPSILRLMEYWLAGLFGGLPLYWTGATRLTAAALISLTAIFAVLKARVWQAPTPLLAAAVATPIGLLLLGAIFDNTPIELRYLSFTLPFCALLLARRGTTVAVRLVLTVQACGIVGLLIAPQTMQPARQAAQAAATLAPGALVLLPSGNDGVGIVGAFGIEADPETSILLVHATDTPQAILMRIGAVPRVALALMAQDADSIAAIARARAALLDNGWRLSQSAARVEVFELPGPATDRRIPDR